MTTPYIGPGATITVHAAAADLPAPTAYDGGVVLDALKSGRTVPGAGETIQALPRSMILRIQSDGLGPVTMPGPVSIRAGSSGRYNTVGQVDGGALSVVVSEQDGRDIPVYPGADWERLRVVTTGPLIGGTVTIKLIAEREV